MKGFVILITVSGIVALVVALVIFPSLEANVNKTRASAAYAEQQKLLAQAEIERARAVTVAAKGEADALRMSINQPIAALAIGASFAMMMLVALMVALDAKSQSKAAPPQGNDYPPLRVVTVLLDG